MKTPIEAMKMALEALKVSKEYIYDDGSIPENGVQVDEAIKALTEAIKQMEKTEPVAWMDKREGMLLLNQQKYCSSDVPLFTHPAQVPADMMLVPREPTEVMCHAGVHEGTEYMNAPAHLAYKAMIAAWEKENGK